MVPGQVSISVRTSDGRVGSGRVTVGLGEAGKIDMQLSPAATLSGRVVNATTSLPVPRARTLIDGQTSRRGMTGADGRFSRTVAVGTHQLVISTAGYRDAASSVNAAGQPPTQNLGDIPLTPLTPLTDGR